MSAGDLDRLPDSARLWIFAAGRALDEDEAGRLREEMERFLEGWAAHGRDLAAGVDVRQGRFLLVAVDERAASASGCSIDALVRQVRTLQQSMGIELLDGSAVWYRDGDELRRVERREFRRLAAEGQVDAETPVFDLTLERLGELRDGRLEVPASDSWHARLLPRERPASAGS